MNTKVRNRIAGAMYGFAIGDAMGATTEFMSEEQIQKTYGKVTDIIGGGWLKLKPGSVTDDTEMMLCVIKALTPVALDDPMGYRFMQVCRDRFVKWFNNHPKDVGGQCARAIRTMMSGRLGARYDESALGNGSLMRALPCAILDRLFLNVAQGRLTHNNSGCTECIELYHKNVVRLLHNTALRALDRPKELMEPTGCVRNTLNNALYWASHCATFEEAIVGAVNHGGDADTIAALTGGLAGARFGFETIPTKWVAALDPNVKAELDAFIDFACKEMSDVYDFQVQ